MVSPVYASYGMFGPVIWNGPGGSVFTLVMRVSGPTVLGRPVPPVPNRNCSEVGSPGSPPGRVRIAAAGGFWTPARSGAGSVVYRLLFAEPALMKYLPPLGADVIWN